MSGSVLFITFLCSVSKKYTNPFSFTGLYFCAFTDALVNHTNDSYHTTNGRLCLEIGHFLMIEEFKTGECKCFGFLSKTNLHGGRVWNGFNYSWTPWPSRRWGFMLESLEGLKNRPVYLGTDDQHLLRAWFWNGENPWFKTPPWFLLFMRKRLKTALSESYKN